MKYYVYAIHTDGSRNRLLDSFDSFQAASAEERRMQDANFPRDNYFVRMFAAESDDAATAKANSLRPR
ncbi:hypothetical protein [Rhizobium sp. PP-CC-3G-465]|uniref:hypothetical protein n=1 Tax=Rhizobium sp. PP-CC-3G-465 TaxID=2135648 RepID=UPI0010469CE1|nr:hypothetical protein C8J33_101884 [Rhizobium sp. PP-CC-3G-465]